MVSFTHESCCLLLPWHQACCQAIPAPHQDPGMVSKFCKFASCKFWLSNRVLDLGQCPWLQLELPRPGPCAAAATTVTSCCHPATLTGSNTSNPITGLACHNSEVEASGGRVPSDSISPTQQALLIFGVRMSQRLPLTVTDNHIPAQQKFQQH